MSRLPQPLHSRLRYASLEMTILWSKRFVFEVAFALQCLGVFVLAQNILVELHVGAKKVLEPRFDALPIFQHLFGDVISVDIDADRANDSEFLSLDRDRCAFEFSRADVQLVIQFLFVEKLASRSEE